MLLKTDKLNVDGSPWVPSPTMLKMIELLARNDRLVRNYSRLGQMLPGVPRKPRGDFVLVPTGEVHMMQMRRGLNGNGKPAMYPSKVYTLIPTERKFNKELSWRLMKDASA